MVIDQEFPSVHRGQLSAGATPVASEIHKQITSFAPTTLGAAALDSETIRQFSDVIAARNQRLNQMNDRGAAAHVRDHLSDFVDRAEREHERVVVTRNGRPAAVLIGYEDLLAIEETLEVLSDGEAMADIRGAREEVAHGEVIEGVDAVRALRPRR